MTGNDCLCVLPVRPQRVFLTRGRNFGPPINVTHESLSHPTETTLKSTNMSVTLLFVWKRSIIQTYVYAVTPSMQQAGSLKEVTLLRMQCAKTGMCASQKVFQSVKVSYSTRGRGRRSLRNTKRGLTCTALQQHKQI